MLAAFAFDQKGNNFEDDTMKVSVNKAKLTGLCTRTELYCYKFNRFRFQNFFGPKKLPGLSRNGSQECSIGRYI